MLRFFLQTFRLMLILQKLRDDAFATLYESICQTWELSSCREDWQRHVVYGHDPVLEMVVKW